jgi:hypothetical protein
MLFSTYFGLIKDDKSSIGCILVHLKAFVHAIAMCRHDIYPLTANKDHLGKATPSILKRGSFKLF